MSPNLLPPVIFLMGPTASGKTALSVQLAQHWKTEIISVDSALVYQGMDIGTAKPDRLERSGIQHHLIDILDPVESFSTGQFRRQALELIGDIVSQGKVPILSGGTMLYFNALLHGMAALPEADVAIRNELAEQAATLGNGYLHSRLQKIDPEAAARIHPNDPQRLQRALEVFEITGTPLTVLQKQAQAQKLPFQCIKLIIAPHDRKILHEKIAIRFHDMLQKGFVEEVECLFQRQDINEHLPSMRCVGYRQVWMYLQGVYDYSQMTEKAIIATRQLAKRQFTWLRKEKEALNFVAGERDLLHQVITAVESRIAGT